MAEEYWQEEEQREETSYLPEHLHRTRAHIAGVHLFIREKKFMLPESIRDTQAFRKVYQSGKSFANRYLVMYVMKNDTEHIRKGISVSKKVGNSVVRHRLTRLIRESIRLNKERVREGYDIVIIARVGAKGKGYKEIESAFMHLCRLHHILKEDEVKSEKNTHFSD